MYNVPTYYTVTRKTVAISLPEISEKCKNDFSVQWTYIVYRMYLSRSAGLLRKYIRNIRNNVLNDFYGIIYLYLFAPRYYCKSLKRSNSIIPKCQIHRERF